MASMIETETALGCPAGADEPSKPQTRARRAPFPQWTFFGTGLLVGLLTGVSMLAAISMMYPTPQP